jgi:hypothetical protein
MPRRPVRRGRRVDGRVNPVGPMGVEVEEVELEQAPATLTFAVSTVTKRYASWDRREPQKRTGGTTIAADLDGIPPSVTMTLVPGQPMTGDLAPVHVRDLATAIRGLWSVPPHAAAVAPWRDDLPFARRLTDGPQPTDVGMRSSLNARPTKRIRSGRPVRPASGSRHDWSLPSGS